MAKELPAPEAARFEPLSVLWRVFAAPQTLMVLLGLVALALLLGSLIPQIPPQATSDPQAWLAVQTGFFGQGNRLVRALGLYDVYHAFWFRLLLVLAGLCLSVRMVESVELAWRVGGRKPWTMAVLAGWGDHPPQFLLSSSLSSEEVQARLGGFATRCGYWQAGLSGLPVPGLGVARRRRMLWVQPLGYAGLLLALVGLAIASTWGWQIENWQLAPGESRAVGHDTPYAVRLDAFELQLGEDGRLQGHIGEIAWLEGEKVLDRATVGVGRPVIVRGIAVRQIGYVPVVTVRGWAESEQPLALQTEGEALGGGSEVEVRFSSPQAQPFVLIPDRDLFLSLSFEPLCAQDTPALHVNRIRGGGQEPETLKTLTESGSVSMGELRLDLDLAYAPLLRVDYRPAMGLVVAGMVLVVAVLIASWVAPPRLAWIAVGRNKEGQTAIQVQAPARAGASRWLRQLAAHLREELADDV